MNKFNNMTISAAAEVICGFHTNPEMDLLAVTWGIDGHSWNSGSASLRVLSFTKIAISEMPEVISEKGKVSLARALVELAITAPVNVQHQIQKEWVRLIAGLRMDGFEIVEESETIEKNDIFGNSKTKTILVLRRMLPADLPELDFREAESELVALLNKHDFKTATGHLNQAISNFSTGNWAAANAQFRTFYEDYLNEIAVKLGCDASKSAKFKRRFLGELDLPFLLSSYNEWNKNDNKPQYVQGLMSRMHPEGSHPGLSEEEDCTFRMQITLITARLFLRRFDHRKQ